jgi:hypothetical protein
MKRNTLYLFLGFISLLSACHKPFEGLTAILSNSYIDYRVSLQVVNANPKATSYYPPNSTITLTGDAITQGLIYTADGTKATEEPGNVKLVNNAVTLAVKPYVKISPSSPLKFTITASAPNYITNTQDVLITNADSLQYVDVKLLNLAALPAGVSTKAATVTSVVNGATTTPFTVTVTSKTTAPSGVTTTQTDATVTFPAKTVFKDVNNAPIATGNSLAINVINFNNLNTESVAAIPGGLDKVATTVGMSSFLLGGAVTITATLGSVPVKSFSNPIAVDIFMPANTYNPEAKSIIKPGDLVPVWSRNDGSTIWVKEGTAKVEAEPSTGRLKTVVSVTHLSTWMVAFSLPQCSAPLDMFYTSTDNLVTPLYIGIYGKEGNSQLLADKVVTAKNGDVISIDLPQGVDIIVKLFAGNNSSGSLIQTVPASACATSINLPNTRTNPNPTLFFDLQTQCQNGTFRYTGPIEYRVTGNSRWDTFTPSDNGRLSTNLLIWNQTYDFRIIYKGTQYTRTKQVLQDEFRANGSVWEYWGKTSVKQTFFNAPTSCN